jgi:hypothetical protein
LDDSKVTTISIGCPSSLGPATTVSSATPPAPTLTVITVTSASAAAAVRIIGSSVLYSFSMVTRSRR